MAINAILNSKLKLELVEVGVELGKMVDFLCIFVRNLKWMAPGLGWWENSEIFFGDS